MSGKYSDMPLWAKLLIIATALPLLAYPRIFAKVGNSTDINALIVLYPACVIVSAVCAWICWPDRREISWILIVLTLLTHAAMLYLINNQ